MVNIEAPQHAQLPFLETFSKAAEFSSFTKAAKALHLTQAAVSQRIHALEMMLKTPLFHRGGGRVLLTEAGHKLYPYAQQILELHEQARHGVTGRSAPVAGELLLAASSIPGEHLLPALLSAFGQRFPHIRVRAAVSDSMAVIAQVERGEINLGLVGKKTDNPQLEFRYLASDRMVLAVPQGHALSKRKKLSVKQLCGHALVLREVGSGLRHCFEKSLERAGRSLGANALVIVGGRHGVIPFSRGKSVYWLLLLGISHLHVPWASGCDSSG
jgi:DNA-binding transcriptional LysR family regulator